MPKDTLPFLGMELGSTRIKAVLINEKHEVLAQGSYDWASRLEDGFWTYDLEEVHEGVRAAYKALAGDYEQKDLAEYQYLGSLGQAQQASGL